MKKSSKQENQEPEIIIDINSKSLDKKNQKENIFQKTKLTKHTEFQTPLIIPINFKDKPIEKSLIKEAFVNLKQTINQKFLFHLNLKILIKVFKGLIAKQLLQNFFNQNSLKKISSEIDKESYNQFKLNFDTLIVENKKQIILDLKEQPPKDRLFIIRKTKWDYLKQECLRNTGRLPDYLFFIKIFKTTSDDLYRAFNSQNLKENLSILEKWVLNYSDNYSAEIVGWVKGVDVEKLNDSIKIQPESIILRKPAFWCYMNDSYVKPISAFNSNLV